MCDKLYQFSLVLRLGEATQKNIVNNRLSCTAHLYPFLSFLCLTVYEIIVEFFSSCLWSERKAEHVKMTVQECATKSCLNSKIPAVWLRNVCSEYPHRSAMKCVKIGKKHLKHRCLADVSHNTSSSSDMASCLSSIHMLMLNQAAQSRSISNHFFSLPFFLFFPSNQFTLERDKSLKSHIRGELEQMVIWTEKKRGKKTGKEAVGE